jgi:hypothetical protein
VSGPDAELAACAPSRRAQFVATPIGDASTTTSYREAAPFRRPLASTGTPLPLERTQLGRGNGRFLPAAQRAAPLRRSASLIAAADSARRGAVALIDARR